MLSAHKAVNRAINGQTDKSEASKYSGYYIILVALTTILTFGVNLFLEAIVVTILWFRNNGYDNKDFIDRLALVSAGPLIRINIWSFVLILPSIAIPPLYFIGMLIVGVYFHTQRYRLFNEMIDARIMPFKKSFVHQSEVDALEAEVEELQRLKEDQTRAQKLRLQVESLRNQITLPEQNSTAQHIGQLESVFNMQPQALPTQSLNNTAERRQVLSKISKAHRLYKQGILSADEFDMTKKDLLYSFDWTSIEEKPQDALFELMALQEQGIIKSDEMIWVKELLFR